MGQAHSSPEVVQRAQLRIDAVEVGRVEPRVGVAALGRGEDLDGLEALAHDLVQLLRQLLGVEGELEPEAPSLLECHDLEPGDRLPPAIGEQAPQARFARRILVHDLTTW